MFLLSKVNFVQNIRMINWQGNQKLKLYFGKNKSLLKYIYIYLSKTNKLFFSFRIYKITPKFILLKTSIPKTILKCIH